MNIKNKFNAVENTLYIPLVARIYVSEYFPDFFYDKKALELNKYISFDKIDKKNNEYFYMASVCRQKMIDEKIELFLKKNERCNVVFLGAGLETAYHRLENKIANFYQIDSENVIERRKELLAKSDNEYLISGDMFTLDWINEIDLSLPTLITASGVFHYYQKSKILELIKSIKNEFLQGELIFDTTNLRGLKIANNYVIKSGNIAAKMYFSIDNPELFAEISDTRLIGVYGFFQSALKTCKGLKKITKIYMYFSDKWKRTMIIHLKLN